MEWEKKEELKRLTKTLRLYQKEARQQYFERTTQPHYETDFYGEVKPFAEKVEAVKRRWKPLALEWIKHEKPKYIYSIQIHHACDNLDAASVLVFQKDARRKRLIEMLKAIDYVLDTMEQQL